MAGIDARTGRPLYGDDRIAQSIRRLVGTQHDLVMRRHLACDLPDAIGAPQNPVECFAYAAAVATALTGLYGEPRLDLREVRFLTEDEVPNSDTEGAAQADGEAWLRIAGFSRETGRAITLTELVS